LKNKSYWLLASSRQPEANGWKLEAFFNVPLFRFPDVPISSMSRFPDVSISRFVPIADL